MNPLEVNPESCEKDKCKNHVKPVRQKWFSCACCPPNLARMIASIGSYVATKNEKQLFVHQYIGGSLSTGFEGSILKINSEFPWDGKVSIMVLGEAAEYDLVLRVPGWCENYSLKLNGKKDGYIYISRQWIKGDSIEMEFDMPVMISRAHPSVRADTGKVAVSRGPVVYCLEEVDNGKELHRVYLDSESKFKVEKESFLDECITLEAEAFMLKKDGWGDSLYKTTAKPEFEARKIKWIPYYLWANRGLGEMMVWVHDGFFIKN